MNHPTFPQTFPQTLHHNGGAAPLINHLTYLIKRFLKRDKTWRYELIADEDWIEKLDRVVGATCLSRVEALWAGLDLLESLVNADRAGKEFAIVPKESSSPFSSRYEHLELKAHPDFIEVVKKLADEDGVTKAEVVRRAIGLYAHAAELSKQGFSLTPTRNDP